MSYGQVVRDELNEPSRELREAIPEVYQGFGELHQAAMVSGALDTKTKELIALALSVSTQCDGCIASHAQKAVRHGATPAEAAEVIGVVFMMRGGPATVYGARAYAAVQEYYADQT